VPLQATCQAALQSDLKIQELAVFLLSQIALAGPKTCADIAMVPGFVAACLSCPRLAVGAPESIRVFTALLVNNVAALGGEEAIRILTMSGELVRELGSWLDDANDAATLQRLTGCFNHLSRSPESAKSLREHGIVDALRRLSARRVVSGSDEAREAYVGLANMALANILVRREGRTLPLYNTDANAIQSIVRFLHLALEQRTMSGISFRVYDVLYGLDSLSKCHDRDLIGIECGLVDVAVQLTREWRPGKYASFFSDAKASTYPVLELSSEILMRLGRSERCRQRMSTLGLESILDGLVKRESHGKVREYAFKVLWELRDKKRLQASVDSIARCIGMLRDLADTYTDTTDSQGWAGHSATSWHNRQALWLNTKVRESHVDALLQSSWQWLQKNMQYDKIDRVTALMRGADRFTLRAIFDDWKAGLSLGHPAHPLHPQVHARQPDDHSPEGRVRQKLGTMAPGFDEMAAKIKFVDRCLKRWTHTELSSAFGSWYAHAREQVIAR